MASDEELEQNVESLAPLKICFVSPYPPRFGGIATYAYELIEALKKRGNAIYIICNPDRNAGGHGGQEGVFPVMDVEKPEWCNDVLATIGKLKPDVVHVQHEYGLYDVGGKLSTDLIDLLIRLNLQRVPTVMTYHSVYSTLSDKECVFINTSLQLVDAGVVHEELQKIFLPINLGWVPQNVYVISHGAEILQAGGAPDQQDAKRRYGLEGKQVVMCLGWWEPYKRFEDVVKIWPEVVREVSNAVLVIAGDARPGSRMGVRYKPTLLEAIEASPAKDSISVIQGSFLPDEYLAVENAADILVFPYNRSSQSGVLAHAFSLGKPVIVTNVGGLEAEVDASGGGLITPLGDLEQLRDYLVLLLRDKSIRERYAHRALAYVEERIGWKFVAVKHQQLYDAVAKNKGHSSQT